MNLLLDTHTWLFGLLAPERLSKQATLALRNPEHHLHLSSISVWESLVLARKKRLDLGADPAAFVKDALASSEATMVPVTHEIALRSENLPGYPASDPADRFLVATALAHELVLVTADSEMRGYEPLRTIW